MHIAVSHNNNEIVKLLLKLGADKTIQDKNGNTAEYYIQEKSDIKKTFELFNHSNNTLSPH